MDRRIAVIRVRGRAKVDGRVKDTLDMLRLDRVNAAVLIDNRPGYLGMLQKVKDYVTWGEVDSEDVALLLRHRGLLRGGERLTEEHVKKNTRFRSIEDFAKEFVEFRAELKDIPGLKPVFRLHPPRKGHGSIKRSYKAGGALGYRGGEIKKLIYRMR